MIVRFDPNSQKLQSWPIPDGGEFVCHISVTGHGNVALADGLVHEMRLVEIK